MTGRAGSDLVVDETRAILVCLPPQKQALLELVAARRGITVESLVEEIVLDAIDQEEGRAVA